MKTKLGRCERGKNAFLGKKKKHIKIDNTFYCPMLADVAFYTCARQQQQQQQRQRVSTTLFFMRIACLDIYHQINMDEIDFFI